MVSCSITKYYQELFKKTPVIFYMPIQYSFRNVKQTNNYISKRP